MLKSQLIELLSQIQLAHRCNKEKVHHNGEELSVQQAEEIVNNYLMEGGKRGETKC